MKVKPRTPSSSQHLTKTVTKQITEHLIDFRESQCSKEKSRSLKQIIKMCYCDHSNQFYLCNNLNVPFRDGPISLNSVPKCFGNRGQQLLSLFKYLQKVKQSYICWIIYADQDLGVLNLKLITQFQIEETEFGSEECLVGIFIGKNYFSKPRTISTKVDMKMNFGGYGLSNKTTKDSLVEKGTKSHKNLKSISMKEKKTIKHDFSNKSLLAGDSFTHKKTVTGDFSFKNTTSSTKSVNNSFKLKPKK